jgi:hypothetical protein
MEWKPYATWEEIACSTVNLVLELGAQVCVIYCGLCSWFLFVLVMVPFLCIHCCADNVFEESLLCMYPVIYVMMNLGHD